MIEAIAAVAIISIALVGFLSQSTYDFTAATESFNRNIALNLAREAVEVVRNRRDANWLRGCPDLEQAATCFNWHSGLSNGAEYRAAPIFDFAASQWSLKFIGQTFDECVASKECILYKNQAGVLTALPDGDESNFFRQVEMRPICEDALACGGDGVCVSGEHCLGKQIGVEVVSRVRWKQGAGWRDEEVVERLYNWK